MAYYAFMTTTYTLRELSAAAGIGPRTIRSYVEQRLIPGPGRRGPASTYRVNHLARLRAIQILKDQHRLRLGEIRHVLDSVGQKQLEAIVLDPPCGSGSFVSAARLALTKKARIGGGGRPADVAERPAPYLTASFGSGKSHMLAALLTGLKPAVGRSDPRRANRDVWGRIVLAPDVELWVRAPVPKHRIRQLQGLTDCIRELLREKQEENHERPPPPASDSERADSTGQICPVIPS